jgi:hypothetical protein
MFGRHGGDGKKGLLVVGDFQRSEEKTAFKRYHMGLSIVSLLS